MDIQRRQEIVRLQEALDLPHPPIGLAFVKEAPAGVGRPDRGVPSACSFWRLAEREVFYASEEEHLHCPIGVHTMGFQVPEARRAEAEAIIKTMCDLEYISPEEAASLPAIKGGHKGIVYGPLAQMPVDPDVAIFFCRPGQAMLLAESSGCVDWTGQGMTVFGRPTCAAIPTALQAARAAMSVGCIGFRVYTGVPEEEMVLAVPHRDLLKLLDRLGTILDANSALEEFHTKRRAAL